MRKALPELVFSRPNPATEKYLELYFFQGEECEFEFEIGTCWKEDAQQVRLNSKQVKTLLNNLQEFFAKSAAV